MKILIVNTNPTQRDGITNVIFNLLQNIKDTQLQFGYVSMNTPDEVFISRLDNLSCKLYVIPRTIKNIHRYISKLSDISRHYDMIHVHGNSATLAIELLAAKNGGIKHRVAHSHNTSCKMVFADKLLRPIFYRLCNGRLACGRDAGKWLYGNRPFQIIQNGINTSRFRFDESKRTAIRKSLGWKDKIIIGHVGNFVEAKNHKFIFEVIKSTIHKNKDIRLVCVGGGRLMEEAKDFISGNGLIDYVHITGSINNPEEYMSAMDIVLMPSIHEGLPLTLIEEQANGLNCLVSDTITIEANLTGSLHFLSLSEPVDSWSDTLLRILSQKAIERPSTSDINISTIKDKGYDIATEAYKLSVYYNQKINPDYS